ncbi:hypothetical protein OIU79_024697 [Salix purpurea]|uniref:Uncharacterized protein n=1 Tax=Salix purpurea TaxID=77065 RepID=A0A9Q0W446_SALPP|nr:hypothetical protein OIU79_024697 [Salix purpurea]
MGGQICLFSNRSTYARHNSIARLDHKQGVVQSIYLRKGSSFNLPQSGLRSTKDLSLSRQSIRESLTLYPPEKGFTPCPLAHAESPGCMIRIKQRGGSRKRVNNGLCQTIKSKERKPILNPSCKRLSQADHGKKLTAEHQRRPGPHYWDNHPRFVGKEEVGSREVAKMIGFLSAGRNRRISYLLNQKSVLLESYFQDLDSSIVKEKLSKKGK